MRNRLKKLFVLLSMIFIIVTVTASDGTASKDLAGSMIIRNDLGSDVWVVQYGSRIGVAGLEEIFDIGEPIKIKSGETVKVSFEPEAYAFYIRDKKFNRWLFKEHKDETDIYIDESREKYKLSKYTGHW